MILVSIALLWTAALLPILSGAGCTGDSGPLEGATGSPPDYALVYDTSRVNTFKFEIPYNEWARMPVKVDGDFTYARVKVTFIGPSTTRIGVSTA